MGARYLVWNWRKGELLLTVSHPMRVNAASFAANDKNLLVNGCGDGVARIWRGTLMAERATLALLGRATHTRGASTQRFILHIDNDHAIWSRVVGFLMWG